MELLQERIRREGRVLPGNIVKVDGFLNHRVDTRLLHGQVATTWTKAANPTASLSAPTALPRTSSARP